MRSIRHAFYVPNSIAIMCLWALFTMLFLVYFFDNGFSYFTIAFLIVSVCLTLVNLYYFYNVIMDQIIRKKGTQIFANITDIIEKKHRFGRIDTIIIYEYTNNCGNVTSTEETINRINHNFKVGEKIKVLTNGKKALLDLKTYEIKKWSLKK